MNLVKRAAQQFGEGLSLADLDRVMDMTFGGAPVYTGKLVNQTTALAVSTVWSCIQILAFDIATLPFPTYRKLDKGKESAPDHYLWNLLQMQANSEMTAWRFKALMQAWLMLWGNAYAEMEISGRGQVTGLWPWRPDRTKVSRDRVGELQYTYTMKDGQKFTLPHHRIFHLRGLAIDTVLGMSPIEVHKQTIGLALAVVEHGARFFGQGARPLGVIKTSAALGDKAYERLKQNWASEHQGLDNAHRVAILEDGADWKEVGTTMVNAQYIETAKLTAQDVARIYNVPLHRLGLQERGSGSGGNVTQQALEYVMYGMMPWAENWRQQVMVDMLSTREQDSIMLVPNFKYFLRGDPEAMGKLIAVLRQWGIDNADEIREDFLDQNPQKNGTGVDYWMPVNMAPEGDEERPPSSTLPMKKVQPKQDANNPPPSKPNGKPNGEFHTEM